MPSTPRIILIALAVVALAASAVVLTDLRDPDDQAPRYQPPAAEVVPVATRHAPWRIATTSESSPFDYILPGVLLLAMLGAGLVYARTSRPPRRSPA